MVNKYKIVLISFICLIGLVGCQFLHTAESTLVYEDLSKREEYLLNLTGNRALIYTLKNMPDDKTYKIDLVYEVYDGGKRVKEQVITGLLNEPLETTSSSKKQNTETIALNIQENKIRYLLGKETAYASGNYNLEEDLSQYSQSWLCNNTPLKLGSDIYIYHANADKNTATDITLGSPVTEDELNKVLKDNEVNIFIKLSFKEI